MGTFLREDLHVNHSNLLRLLLYLGIIMRINLWLAGIVSAVYRESQSGIMSCSPTRGKEKGRRIVEWGNPKKPPKSDDDSVHRPPPSCIDSLLLLSLILHSFSSN
ncbi:uncharacterized protein BO87DRAFT_5614 [Aspergillus neoniger CBS 115656]|uniref:Uncharacterized protein n=1 Tax=Aspergillus neoniger (strain CBS 115656) TaxID=1448310 RepID=A0A318YXR8_ASPNB|nr:hypothetical protein BO87DRAFT_5614 [Aspergillus neoniger CBS 115656]PYH39725.1 hypothetical protein BO87DRAFT_5614 [Aspergillus neoniger CBS 115656]